VELYGLTFYEGTRLADLALGDRDRDDHRDAQHHEHG